MQKFRAELQKRFEPFGRLARLMVKRVAKGPKVLQPRSALTPPRSPAPIKATRPDFPVRAGQFFGPSSVTPASGKMAAHTRQGLRSLSPHARNELSCGVIRCDFRAQPLPVVSQSLRGHSLHETMICRDRRLATASSCRNDHPHVRSIRSPKSGGRSPSGDERTSSSCITAVDGSTITARSSSSAECVRRSGRVSDGRRSPPRRSTMPDRSKRSPRLPVERRLDFPSWFRGERCLPVGCGIPYVYTLAMPSTRSEWK